MGIEEERQAANAESLKRFMGQVDRAELLHSEGLNNLAIAENMGITESTVIALLEAPGKIKGVSDGTL